MSQGETCIYDSGMYLFIILIDVLVILINHVIMAISSCASAGTKSFATDGKLIVYMSV